MVSSNVTFHLKSCKTPLSLLLLAFVINACYECNLLRVPASRQLMMTAHERQCQQYIRMYPS